MPNPVRYDRQDRVAVVTIDNPPVNALGPGVWEAIEAEVARGAADAEVDAIVLVGAGKTFIAGADINIFKTLKTREQSLERSSQTHARLKRIEDTTKPVVAAIHGTALGGGLEVAMACHFRVATADARVGQPEVLLGIIPGADLYDGRLTHVKELFGKNVFTTRDYRELLSRSDIDAVIIATPDHWHQKISIEAMKANKDVYCEKPMVQKLEEGLAVVETQNQTKRIFQVGSQFVSSVVYKKAKEILASGAIGQLNLVDSSLWRRGAMSAWQYSIPPDASPETCDWDRFVGHAPKVQWDPKRFFRWRNYRDYGTGIGGDLFVHQFTSAHFVTNSKGPSRVFATGGLRLWNDGRDVPDVLLGLFDYPKTDAHPAFTMNFRVSLADGGTDQRGWGTWTYRFVGSDGVIELGDDLVIKRPPPAKEPGTSIDTFPEAVQKAFMDEYRKQYPRGEAEVREIAEVRYVPPPRYDERLDHFKNFFKAMRTRERVLEDAAYGFRAAAPALMVNVSYFENRVCEWDPESMKLKTKA